MSSYITKTEYDYGKACTPRAFHWLVGILLAVAVWVLPFLYIEYLGLWGAIGVIVAFHVVISILGVIGQKETTRRVFEESDEHTHDDNCAVCALTFSNAHSLIWNGGYMPDPYAWKCRHGTNLSPTYNRAEVLKALHG